MFFAPGATYGVPAAMFLGSADGSAKLVWQDSVWDVGIRRVGKRDVVTVDAGGVACGETRENVTGAETLSCKKDIVPSNGKWVLADPPKGAVNNRR